MSSDHYSAINVGFSYSDGTEHRIRDDTTTTGWKQDLSGNDIWRKQVKSLKIPLLAIVHIPSLSITKVSIDFTATVKGTLTQDETNNTTTDTYETTTVYEKQKGEVLFSCWGVESRAPSYNVVKSKSAPQMVGSVTQSSKTKRTTTYEAEYAFKIKASDRAYPEGLKKVMDMLDKSITSNSSSRTKAYAAAEKAQKQRLSTIQQTILSNDNPTETNASKKYRELMGSSMYATTD